MLNITVGIGDICVTRNKEESLKTYALGSCIALVLFDEQTGTGGMAHIALSNSKVNREKSIKKPGYFVDTGVPLLLKEMQKYSPGIDRSKLKAYIIGGASIYEYKDFFKIGENNIKSAKKLLREIGIKITQEDTGKQISRTVELEVSTGRVIVSNQKIGKWEL
jgi:chemotaxis protein CheD